MTDRAPVELSLIRELATLGQIAPDWDRLAVEGIAPSPFKSAAWVISFLEYRLTPGQNWVCLTAERQGRLVAVLPLITTEKNRTAQAPSDYHTYSVEPVLSADESPDLLFDLFAFACEQLPEISEIEFTRLPESAALLQLDQKDDPRFRTIRQFDGIGNIILTSGEYESYRAEFNRNFQRNLKKSANRINKLGEVEISFAADTGTSDQLEKFLAIEASGWKSREESAIASDRNLVDFYRKLIERLNSLKWLEWEFLEAGGQTLAANLALKFKSTLFLVKIGYNEEHARLAPGSRLMELVLQRAFDDSNIATVDLLTDMEWHTNWHPQPLKYFNIFFYPARGNTAYRKRKFGIWLRQQSWLVTLVRAIKKKMGREV